MLSLCFVCDEYPPLAHGGIGTFVQVLGRALVRRGHAVRVVGAGARAGHVLREQDEGVDVWRLPRSAHRFAWIGARRELFRSVSAWADRGEVDLVEVPDWEGWAAGWPGLPVPIVSRLHGSGTYFAAELGTAPRPVTRWLEGRSLARSDAWFGTSEYVARRTQELFGRPGAPIRVVYNCVEPAEMNGAGARAPGRVVFSGTLTAKKGVVSLIRAWPLVLSRRPDAELHLYGKDTDVAGQGPMSGVLRGLLDEEARRSVHFHGHVSRAELRGALARARAAVFPSLAEAFGLAPVEAMACGCATITSRRGPGPELVRDGRDALLIDPEDPAGIADAVSRVLADDALAAALGDAGRQRAEACFSLEPMVARNEELYAECIGDFAGGKGR